MRFSGTAGLFVFTILFSPSAIGVGAAQAEVQSNVRYVGYDVRGLTAAEIWRDITRKGPHQRQRGLYAQAEAQVRYGWDAKYASNGSACRVQSAVVTVDVKIVLPNWVDKARGSGALQTAWSNYIAKVRRHEDHHKDIALATAKEIDQAIMAAPMHHSCRLLKRYIKTKSDEILWKEQAQQAHFDRTDRPLTLMGGH